MTLRNILYRSAVKYLDSLKLGQIVEETVATGKMLEKPLKSFFTTALKRMKRVNLLGKETINDQRLIFKIVARIVPFIFEKKLN